MIRNDPTKEDSLFYTRGKHILDVQKCCLLMAKAFPGCQIDIDILKASALLHDIGHTPFGHAGEEAINLKFLSNDGSHYSETFPGLFRHNINSIRIIGEHFLNFRNCLPLLDGILKHTSPFPGNYCISVFKEANIAKSNFIIRLFADNIEKQLIPFQNILSAINCEYKSIGALSSCSSCHICVKKEVGKAFCWDPDVAFLLSAYFCYPFALTYEGAILFLSDEIACFHSDLQDFYVYLSNFEHSSDTLIPLTRLNNAVSLLSTIYKDNELVELLLKYVNALKAARNFPPNDISYITWLLNQMEICLIQSAGKSNGIVTKSGSFSAIITKSGCLPLIALSTENDKIMKTVKSAIYGDIHSLPFVHETNELGKKAISSLMDFYLNHFSDFLKDSKEVNQSPKTRDLIQACANVLGKSFSEVEPLFAHDAIGVPQIQMVLLGDEPLLFTALFKNGENVKMKGVLISNLLKREIGYFIASLSETGFCNLLSKRDIAIHFPNNPNN